MACCKCCCGNVDCTEGQEGKCCCGGIYGECCQEGEYCCSGVCEAESCGCVCPAGCVEGVQLSLGSSPTCDDGVYSDFTACEGGGVSATMYCVSGEWFGSVSVCCYENEELCFASYSAELECEEDGLPSAGGVSLTQLSLVGTAGCPNPMPPVVTISK